LHFYNDYHYRTTILNFAAKIMPISLLRKISLPRLLISGLRFWTSVGVFGRQTPVRTPPHFQIKSYAPGVESSSSSVGALDTLSSLRSQFLSLYSRRHLINHLHSVHLAPQQNAPHHATHWCFSCQLTACRSVLFSAFLLLKTNRNCARRDASTMKNYHVHGVKLHCVSKKTFPIFSIVTSRKVIRF